jgi:Ser/Thr protein kinase RdoA (MazF antagonist)
MSELSRLMRLVYTPRGEDALPTHVEDVYGVPVKAVTPLDMGVYRLDREGCPPWVARVFIPERTRGRVEADAELLDFLAEHDFPSERTAVPNPVSMLDEQPVLLTEFVEGKVPAKSQRAIRIVGDSLGRLHAMPIDGLSERQGGSLHHVPGFEGLPGKDLELAEALLADIDDRIPSRARAGFERLREAVDAADDCSDLPRSLVHPDPVLKNMIANRADAITFVDWSGAGSGPRVVSLAQFIPVARTTKGWDRTKLGVIADAYRAHVTLTPEEIDRIGAAMRIRHIWLAAWNYWTRTMRGNPPKGDEWWLRRVSYSDPSLSVVMHSAFGS